MMKLITVIVSVVTLTGCALFQEGELPENKLYNATVGYWTSLKLALVYESLPRCMDTVSARAASNLCSTPTAVEAIRLGDNAAKSALDLLGAGIPTNPGIEALRVGIEIDRAKLHAD